MDVGKNDRGRDRERRRRQHQHPAHRPSPARAEDQELIKGLRSALRSDDPLDLLAVVSGFLEVSDPRSRNPFDREQPRTTLDDLLESLLDAPFAETTAALTAMRVLVPDELTAARIARALQPRTHPLPAWLNALGQARVEPEVWFLTHVLGDGDDYLLGVTLPTGHTLSALIYIDHNLGGVVKDAFVVPDTLEDLAIKLGRTMPDPDQSLTRTDPATARAVIARAIKHGSRLYPPPQSDTWPMCRPVIEWMLRLLPDGGLAPEIKEWTEAETEAIAEDFFGGPFGAPLDRADERDLLYNILWFATSYATGDPLRWSPVTVELLLADWVPRKILADPAHLAKLPNLLRAYIRHCHDQLGIRSELTDETLAAVDAYEPDYQRAIRTSRPRGPAALLANLFDGAEWAEDEPSTSEIMLESLDRRVGGRLALQDLDDRPLPDEPFEWAGIPTDIHPVLQQVLDACDHCADDLLDVEHRTAMRRFLSRAAATDPALFRRKASPTRGAAAIAWIICRANDTVGSHRSRLTVADLLAHFDITGSVSQRAEPLLRANGIDPHQLYGSMTLGTPDLLTADKRHDLITLRERWLDR